MNHAQAGSVPSTAHRESRSAPIRVLLVDDQQLVREGLRKLLTGQADLEVVAEAETAASALAVLAHARPNMLLVDAMLPEMESPTLIRDIRTRCPAMGVIALSDCDERRCVVRHPGVAPMRCCWRAPGGPLANKDCLELARLAGAHGVLRKTCPCAELLSAIRVVARGDQWMERPSVSRPVERPELPSQAVPGPLRTEGLTRREVEVIRELCQGRSNKQIGRVLKISEQTVKNTVSRVLGKLGLEDRVQLALYAVETRLLERHAPLLS